MIHSIRGIIQFVTQSYVIIDMHGLSWLIYASTSTLEILTHQESKEVTVYTWLQISDNAMTLYGFTDIAERDLFLALVSVNGIGPKGAIKILSNEHFTDIITHIERNDVQMLAKKAKISHKKAQGILLKLENTFVVANSTDGYSQSLENNTNQLREQIITGLIGMGYTRKQIEDTLKNTIDKQKIDLNTERLPSILKALIIYLQQGVFTLSF